MVLFSLITGAVVVGPAVPSLDEATEFVVADVPGFVTSRLGLLLAAAALRWLAGDLHVHSTYSHDSWDGTPEDEPGPAEPYTLGSSVAQQFQVAALRGLDWMALTDHNNLLSVADEGFGAYGVVPLPPESGNWAREYLRKPREGLKPLEVVQRDGARRLGVDGDLEDRLEVRERLFDEARLKAAASCSVIASEVFA